MSISVMDFFSGCGGTAVGFRDAGMTILGGIDSDSDAAMTYQNNFPEASFFERDIREIQASEVKALLPRSSPVLFSGCAPCQPFSKHKSGRHITDPRRLLLNEFERFVVELRPEFVVVENVPGMQRVGAKGPFAAFVKSLANSGYEFDTDILAASSFGVPQVRRRLVLIASRMGGAPLPSPTHGVGLALPTTVRDWISGLPPLEAGGVDPRDSDHEAMGLSPLNLKRIQSTPYGGGRESWPNELSLECHRDHRGHSDVYGRLSWDKPAAALTTRCLSYSNGRFGHPEQHRAISVREAACLQTFPRSFRFSGGITSKGRQVGNAVPPLLARQIGKALVDSASASKRRRRSR